MPTLIIPSEDKTDSDRSALVLSSTSEVSPTGASPSLVACYASDLDSITVWASGLKATSASYQATCTDAHRDPQSGGSQASQALYAASNTHVTASVVLKEVYVLKEQVDQPHTVKPPKPPNKVPNANINHPTSKPKLQEPIKQTSKSNQT